MTYSGEYDADGHPAVFDGTKPLPEGSVAVERQGNIIKTTLKGWITERLTEQVQNKIQEELMTADQSCILYDGLEMHDPSLTLVFLMQSFHSKFDSRIARSAIVVPGYRLAFLSRLAFGEVDSKYRVFYNNRTKALEWLKTWSGTGPEILNI